MSGNWQWQSPEIKIDSETIKLSEIDFGDNKATSSNIKNKSFEELIPKIMDDMKHIISQSKIVPTPDNWFARKTGIAKGKEGSKIYGFRERCAIPVFRSPSMSESDSQKLGLGHTADVDTDYTKLDRFEYLVKTNPSYVEKLLTDILVNHLKKKGVTTISDIDSYLSSVNNVKFDTIISKDDKINGVKQDEACKRQKEGKGPEGEGKEEKFYPEKEINKIKKNTINTTTNKTIQKFRTRDMLKENLGVTINSSNINNAFLSNRKGLGNLTSNLNKFNNYSNKNKKKNKNESKSNEEEQSVVNSNVDMKSLDIKVNTTGGSIYKEYSNKIGSAKSLNQIKKIGSELKKLMTKGDGEYDKQFTKIIEQLRVKRDELAKKK